MKEKHIVKPPSLTVSEVALIPLQNDPLRSNVGDFLACNIFTRKLTSKT